MSRQTGSHLPTGTVTFLFTDIEGSTLMVKDLGTERFGEVLQVHAAALQGAFAAHDGVVVGTEGDSFFCVFRMPSQAVAAAVDAQRALAEAVVPHGVRLKVRMGMHTGEGTLGDPATGGDYVGFDVHRAARVASSGHGGQVLLSETTQALVHDRLPTGVTLLDLGIHRFKDLGRPERVYQLVVHGLPSTFPRIKSLDRTPNNLPSQMTSFIGREDDIQRGAGLLGGTRLLTLTGPGGTGKTRLSLQIAAAAADAFPDGVHFVALASIADPALVLSTVAHELGVPPEGTEPLDRLVKHIGGKKMLVVLDNFEQILEAAPRVGELLHRTPELKLIATSRAALRLYGEQEMPVPPLDLPDPAALPSLERLSQFEAVRLFIERARAAKPDFAVTNDNAPAIAGICARLDGLPLALELAAARIRVLGPQAIFQRLEKSLALLGGGARDLPARQQTLRGAIAWSYDLLDAPAKRLFHALSWFSGGGLTSDVETVWAEAGGDPAFALDGLEVLTEHSLARQRDEDGASRFFMLQTIREYGLEALAQSPEASAFRRAHALAYLALAEEQGPRVMTSGRKVALDRIEREVDNLRTALDWAIGAGEPDLATRFVAALWRMWQARGYLQEGRVLCERVLAMPGVESARAFDDALEAEAGLVYWLGDVERTQALYERLLERSRARGDEGAIANAAYNLSFPIMFKRVEIERGRALVDEALGLYRARADKAGVAKTLWAKSQLPVLQGDAKTAGPLIEEAVGIFRHLDDPFGLGWALHTKTWVHCENNEREQGRAAAQEALRIFADMRDLSGIALVLDDLARVELLVGRDEDAVKLAAAAAALTRRTGVDLASEVQKLYSTNVRPARLPEERLKAAWDAGAAMSCDEAVTFALSER